MGDGYVALAWEGKSIIILAIQQRANFNRLKLIVQAITSCTGVASLHNWSGQTLIKCVGIQYICNFIYDFSIPYAVIFQA